ncbi:MAG: hypothetical protein CMJ94_11175 [Planctomycetes bacterium]|nr:hypothetical protein [Planctomycetota bacterium]
MSLFRFALFLVLALASCQAGASSDFPNLHPRERALYTTLKLEPGGQEFQLAGLTRTRQTASVPATVEPTPHPALEIELRADRESSLYSGTLLLRAADGSWSASYRLPPRSSGRWTLDLARETQHHGYAQLQIEIEPDPYWEMDQQRPGFRSSL